VPGTRVVTVSATYGAGGSVVAPRLAERLGIPFADRLIPPRGTTTDPTGEQLSDEEREETTRRGFFARLAHLTGGFGFPVPDVADLRGPVRAQVEASITRLADGAGGVILGRGASLVLAGHPTAFHVRLDGPEERRCRQAMSIEGIDASTALDRLKETDRARAQYVSRLYERDAADFRLYHMILDSTVIPLNSCVDVIDMAALAFWKTAS
jgi:cytidylate kinase